MAETLCMIERRWIEIDSSRELDSFYKLHRLFSSEFLSRIDDLTIDLAGGMNYLSLAKVFCVLAEVGRRATPLLRALAYHMAKQPTSLPVKIATGVLFSMNSLHFQDAPLAEKLCKDLLPQVEGIERSATVRLILIAMGQLKLRNVALLETLSIWLETHLSECKINDIVAFILTSANLSYMASNSDTLLKAFLQNLQKPGTLADQPVVWLDLVWSLCVLDLVTKDQLASTLTNKFEKQLPHVTPETSRLGIRLKLMNVNAYARTCAPAYKGPLRTFTEPGVIATPLLAKRVQETLRHFLPTSRYFKENVQTAMGILIHAELAVDCHGQPIAVEDYSTNFGECTSPKPLPSGGALVALLVCDYKDFTFGTKELTGINRLAMRLIEKQGYKIVQIPFYEFNPKDKILSNVQYLESKIKAAVFEPVT